MSEERHIAIDAEELAGRRFPYQEDMSLVDDVDLLEATPGEDINWLEDVELLQEEGVPAVFDRYSNSFLKIYFPIPEGRENELARKVLDHAPPVGQLVRDPAEGAAREVPPARARPVGRGLEDGRRRLEAAGPRGLGASRRSLMSKTTKPACQAGFAWLTRASARNTAETRLSV